MQTIVLVVHVLLAVSLVGVILLQRSEGGALGIGGGGGGVMTGRGAANLLTRATAVLAALFFITSITLSVLAGRGSVPPSIIEEGRQPAPTQPVQPSGPAVPLSR